jgi:2-C-methyl-D-erythritol 4-phosphate cytidylyltransferase
VEAFGIKIHLVAGEEQNFKITGPIDLLLAEQWLSSNADRKT